MRFFYDFSILVLGYTASQWKPIFEIFKFVSGPFPIIVETSFEIYPRSIFLRVLKIYGNGSFLEKVNFFVIFATWAIPHHNGNHFLRFLNFYFFYLYFSIFRFSDFMNFRFLLPGLFPIIVETTFFRFFSVFRNFEIFF